MKALFLLYFLVQQFWSSGMVSINIKQKNTAVAKTTATMSENQNDNGKTQTYMKDGWIEVMPSPNLPSKLSASDLAEVAMPQDSTYYKDKNKIYYFTSFYEHMDSVSPLPISPKVTFYAFDEAPFGKTNNEVFFKESLIRQADPKTFQVLGSCFSHDRNHVYAREKIIPEADLNSFEIVANGIDDPSACPPDSFGVLNGFAKDKYHVYYLENILPESVPATFSIFSGDSVYGTDGKRVYYFDKPVVGADVASFDTTLSSIKYTAWAKDKNHIYYGGEIVQGANLETFQVIYSALCSDACDDSYATDKQNIYYQGKKIPGGDPKSFTRQGENFDAKDKYGKFYDGKRTH